ncbi:hypothetical protein J6590_030507 [Homalodisca vitripennis]|nr:hypothetical protein J6590_030507 [Homalodisca vitripennis]
MRESVFCGTAVFANPSALSFLCAMNGVGLQDRLGDSVLFTSIRPQIPVLTTTFRHNPFSSSAPMLSRHPHVLNHLKLCFVTSAFPRVPLQIAAQTSQAATGSTFTYYPRLNVEKQPNKARGLKPQPKKLWCNELGLAREAR